MSTPVTVAQLVAELLTVKDQNSIVIITYGNETGDVFDSTEFELVQNESVDDGTIELFVPIREDHNFEDTRPFSEAPYFGPVEAELVKADLND